MISIIIKEIREAYLTIMLSSIGTIFILYLIDAFDIASMIIFGFIAPIYVFATSHTSFSRERSLGTDKLLISLPLSKKKIWVGKVIGSFINGLIIYLSFLLLFKVLGIQILPLYLNIRNSDIVSVFILMILPFFSWAFGTMAGTLHPVLSVIVLTSVPIVILLPLHVGGQGVLGMSPLWVLVVSCMTFLSTSYFVFKNYFEVKGIKLLIMNIKKLLAGVFIAVISIFLLNNIGRVMNRNWSKITFFNIEETSAQGRSIVCITRNPMLLDLYLAGSVMGGSSSITYDYRLLDESFITNDEKAGYYNADLNKVKLTTFAKRDARYVVYDSKFQKALFESKLNSPVFLTYSLYSQDIATSKTTYIDSLSKPLGFLDNGNVLYYSYVNKDTANNISNRRGQNVDSSYISLKQWNAKTHTISEVASFSNKAHFSIIPDSKKIIVNYPGKDFRIIRLDNFKVVRLKELLELPDNYVIKHYFSKRLSDFIVVENTEDKSKRHFQVSQNNKVRELDFSSVLTPKHKIVFLDENSQGTSFYVMSRNYFYRSLEETKENEKLLMCKRGEKPVVVCEHKYLIDDGLFTNSGSHFLFEYRDSDVGYSTISIIDSSTIQTKLKGSSQDYSYISGLKPFKNDSFITSGLKSAFYFNHITQKTVHLYDLKDILRKEGIIND